MIVFHEALFVPCKAKVAKFDLVVVCEKHILRLEVAVKDPPRVKVYHGKGDLLCYLKNLEIIRQLVFVLTSVEDIEETSIRNKLSHHVVYWHSSEGLL